MGLQMGFLQLKSLIGLIMYFQHRVQSYLNSFNVKNVLERVCISLSLGQTVERPAKETARPMTIEEREMFNAALQKSRSTEMVKNAIRLLMYSMMRSIEICRL